MTVCTLCQISSAILNTGHTYKQKQSTVSTLQQIFLFYLYWPNRETFDSLCNKKWHLIYMNRVGNLLSTVCSHLNKCLALARCVTQVSHMSQVSQISQWLACTWISWDIWQCIIFLKCIRFIQLYEDTVYTWQINTMGQIKIEGQSTVNPIK